MKPIEVLRWVGTAVPLALCLQLAIAQQPTTGGGGAPTGAGGTTGAGGAGGGAERPTPGGGRTNTPTLPGTDPRQQQPQMPTDMQRPMYVEGKVMMDDGTPPPEPVTIERVCNGNPRPEAYTDTKGRFHF